MSLFELIFGLSAVILGLALTHRASSLRRLLLAGSRVHRAPEPLLLCALIFIVIVSLWLTQWQDRAETHTTGIMLLQVCKLLMPYLAAAFVLPDDIIERETIDLYRHYDRTRVFTYPSFHLPLSTSKCHSFLPIPL